MLNKILFRFGYVPEQKRQEAVNAIVKMANERNLLTEEIASLKREKLALQAEVAVFRNKDEKSKPLVDVSLGDPIPSDSEARKMYVAQVAGFFKEIMEPKLKYMISTTHNLFEGVTNERDLDLILKGVVYSFRELITWGNAMLNEQLANQIEGKITDEEVKTLQDKLN